MAGKKSRQAKAGKQGKAAVAAQPLAALYNLDAGTERGDAVRAVLAACGIRVKTVAAAHLNDPVGAVAGIAGMRPSSAPFTGDAPACEFMLLANVSSPLLDQLLAAMREADASVGCKAQVTQHNRLWPFSTLVREVSREHEAMQEQAAESARAAAAARDER